MPSLPYYDLTDLVSLDAFLTRFPRRTAHEYSNAKSHENQRARKRGEPVPFPPRRRDNPRNVRVESPVGSAAPHATLAVPMTPESVDVASETMMAQADRATGLFDVKAEPTPEMWEAYFAALESANDARAGLSVEQETTTFVAPDDGLPIGVLFTGDWHCGAGGVQYDHLRRDMEMLRDEDGLYGVGMGDYVENVTPQSKAGTALYGGLFNEPGVQGRYALARASIAKGKWLSIINGNHDSWSYKFAGISRTDEFAAKLGAAYFGEGGGAVVAHVGTQRYVIGVRHNTAGNSRLNTTNAQRRLFTDFPLWDNCHAIVCAHLHFNDLQIATMKAGRCVYLRSGTYKVRDGYSKDHGFTPEYGTPLIILFPDHERVLPFRGDDAAYGLQMLRLLRAEYRAKRS